MEQGCSQLCEFLFLTASDSKKKGIHIFCERQSSTKEARGLLKCYVCTRTAVTENDEVRNTQAEAAQNFWFSTRKQKKWKFKGSWTGTPCYSLQVHRGRCICSCRWRRSE